MATVAQKGELEIIRKKNGGTLKAEDVVSYARNPKTALHAAFEWDDSVAAEEYRLQQARQLIRVIVIRHEGVDEPVRVYASLRPDRQKGVGYRAMVDVMSDERQMEQLINDAKRELEYFTKKYATLRDVAELSGVFEAIDTLKTPVATKRRRRGESRAVV